MCILEAFSFSKPVIASNVGGIPEILNGINGKAVAHTEKDFSDAIQYFLEDSTVYNNACANARKTYEDDFEDVVMAERYMKLYKKIYKGK